MSCAIAVHVGAGFHSVAKEKRYRTACARSCQAAIEALRNGATALEAVEKAIRELENDSVTNAGYGSNLTLRGTVECDASIMEGRDGGFGAVGAVSGVRNPISTAKCLVDESAKGLMSLGRIPPMFLAGAGARDWAQQHGLDVDNDGVELISDDALETYVSHLTRVNDDHRVRGEPLEPARAAQNMGHDTVGAVCVDTRGSVAAGVSSGGISLKFPGRVGEAAMYGCGCWAQDPAGDVAGVGCSTTGTGEQLMKTLLAKTCADRVLAVDDMQVAMAAVVERDFIASPLLRGYEEKNAGILAIKVEDVGGDEGGGGGLFELWYGHTTLSMGIGYMTDQYSKPKTGRRRGRGTGVYLWRFNAVNKFGRGVDERTEGDEVSFFSGNAAENHIYKKKQEWVI
ncbi:threonine aspartase 1-like protein [Endogone sp. FLAS-F59071]|nr:threonine aspartase 1-like protein [Endogone sp. FLAS-F59071]|eukprot:RUS22276.1 threonine aspartase 1-like protein [Endogone sp. FLAS-F59071]